MLNNYRLKELRLSHNMSQMELAIQFGVTTSTISKWELGAVIPPVESLIKYSQFFNVNVDYILGISDISNLEKTNTTSFTQEELDLLDLYRKLPANSKYEVKGFMKGIISSTN